MKIVLVILTFLGIQARADYNSPEFKNCYDKQAFYLGGAKASEICEKWTTDNLIFLFANLKTFESCYAKNSFYIGGAQAANKCVELHAKGLLQLFADPEFDTCYNNYAFSIGGDKATNACVENLKYKAAKNQSPDAPLDQVNEKLQLPEGAQILLGAEVEIAAHGGCGAPMESKGAVRCYVCQKKSSRNGMIYTTDSILKSGEVKMHDSRKMIEIALVDSDELEKIQCRSNDKIVIDSMAQLAQFLKESGFGFNNAPSIRKTVGTGAQP